MEKMDLICCDCAMKLGGRYIEGVASYHEAKCDNCRFQKIVTQPRDYGLLFFNPVYIEKFRYLTR